MDKKNTLSLCMIVKDEEKYLSLCLDSVKDIVDEFIIVDTGSTDKTVDIANAYGAKIFHYEWNSNFSHARNFSISQATSDWILLLDADEVLETNDKDKLIKLLDNPVYDGYHFTIHNYNGKSAGADYSIHYGFRLLRNNSQYQFEGAIHEQISSINGQDVSSKMGVENIILYHYGYLDSVVNEKDKRSRNIPIIIDQLKSDPNNPFYLFNLGNEYLATGDLSKTLSIYELSHKNITTNQAFVPHLFYRMVMCLYQLKSYKRAIEIANEALVSYPKCTDIEYCKGMAYYSRHQYTLAIESLKKCITMGPPPPSLTFINACGTYRPHLVLGEIYMYLDDWDNALNHFTQAINLNNSLYSTLYQIGAILKQKYTNDDEILSNLACYFSNLDFLPNLLVYIDILINSQVYGPLELYLTRMNTLEGNTCDKLYLINKFYFFTKQYDLAFSGFQELLQRINSPTILPEIKTESLKFSFILALIIHKPLDTIVPLIKESNNSYFKKVYLELYNIYIPTDMTYLTDSDDPNIYLELIREFLDKLLKIEEFELFEKSLSILNHVNSKEVLLQLAKVYYENNFNKMAVDMILRSIKELDTINHSSLDILSKEI